MNREYLSNFFEGPFPSKSAAIRGTVRVHGEKALVVGASNGSWWARPWREENFRQEHWPEGFESVSRFDVRLATMPQLRFHHSNEDLDDMKILTPTTMGFANWLKGERAAPMVGSRYDFRQRPE